MYSVKKEVGDTELFILKDGETEFGKETFIVNGPEYAGGLVRGSAVAPRVSPGVGGGPAVVNKTGGPTLGNLPGNSRHNCTAGNPRGRAFPFSLNVLTTASECVYHAVYHEY